MKYLLEATDSVWRDHPPRWVRTFATYLKYQNFACCTVHCCSDGGLRHAPRLKCCPWTISSRRSSMFLARHHSCVQTATHSRTCSFNSIEPCCRDRSQLPQPEQVDACTMTHVDTQRHSHSPGYLLPSSSSGIKISLLMRLSRVLCRPGGVATSGQHGTIRQQDQRQR